MSEKKIEKWEPVKYKKPHEKTYGEPCFCIECRLPHTEYIS